MKRALIWDYIFLLRPSLLLPIWVFLFLGYFWGSGESILGITLSLPLRFWRVLISYSLLCSGVYVFNQIFDIESDKRNKKLFLLPEGIISIPTAWICFFILVGISFITGISLGRGYLILWLITAGMGILYSLPPFTFKGRPFLDLISNSLGYGLVTFLIGFGVISKTGLLHSLPYIFATGAVFLHTTIPDIEGDREMGEITTGVFLGVKRTSLFALLLLIIGLILSIYLKDPFAGIISLLSLPGFILAYLKTSDERSKRAYRIGVYGLGLLIALRFPPLLILGFLTLLALRIYYRYRFNLVYPTV